MASIGVPKEIKVDEQRVALTPDAVRELASHGLPAFLAYGVFTGELIAPLMVILGYQTRIGALLIVINMVVAIALVHAHQLIALGRNGGLVLELQYFYLLSALALIFLGPGKYKLKN